MSTSRFSYEEIDKNRQNCLLIHHDGSLTVVKKEGVYYYVCPFDYAVLFKGNGKIFTITLAGEEAWYSRECSPLGCDHYRWFLYKREVVLPYFTKFARYSVAVLLSPEIVFVLDRRKEGFPAPFTH